MQFLASELRKMLLLSWEIVIQASRESEEDFRKEVWRAMGEFNLSKYLRYEGRMVNKKA